MKKTTQKNYTDAFKDEAIKLVTDHGHKTTEATRKLGVHHCVRLCRFAIVDSTIGSNAVNHRGIANEKAPPQGGGVHTLPRGTSYCIL